MSTLKAANIQNTGSGAPTFKNSSGTEIGQLVKMWVNFKGTGTVAIRDDFNASSITDNGTGDYTISFTNGMSGTNYCTLGTSNYEKALGGGRLFTSPRTHATGSIRIQLLGDSGSSVAFDSEDVCVAIFEN
jgi:hypothetical protein|tara:strand:- start:484 stop:876 length:393 start_codon:yes stop_codon:yes gene_type:complete